MECIFIVYDRDNNPIAVCSSIKGIKRKLYFEYESTVTSNYTGNYVDVIEQWWINIGQYNYTIEKIENWDN